MLQRQLQRSVRQRSVCWVMIELRMLQVVVRLVLLIVICRGNDAGLPMVDHFTQASFRLSELKQRSGALGLLRLLLALALANRMDSEHVSLSLSSSLLLACCEWETCLCCCAVKCVLAIGSHVAMSNGIVDRLVWLRTTAWAHWNGNEGRGSVMMHFVLCRRDDCWRTVDAGHDAVDFVPSSK